MTFEPLVKRCAAGLEAFLSQGTEFATRDDADVMRRSRAFGLIAIVLLAFGCVVMAGNPDLRDAAVALVVPMISAAVTVRTCALQGGRFARLATHISLGLALIALTAGAVQLGSWTSINVTIPSLLVLITCHILGVRAAAYWTVAAVVSLAVGIYLPEPTLNDSLDKRDIRFMARCIPLLGFLAIAVAGRRVADSRAKQIEFLARHDGLTGIMNRWEFEQHLSDAIARSRRYKRSVALIFLDLDRFKEVNDTYGHLAGDMVLKEAAKRISDLTRETDSAARAGGDEFLVLLDAVSGEDAAELCAKRLIESSSQPMDIAGQQIQLDASAGIALYPTDGEDVVELTSAADQAMYDAKRNPGRSVHFYSAAGA